MIGGFSPSLMYDKIEMLANNPEEVIMKMKAHEAGQQQEVNLERIELLPLAKTWTKRKKRSSKHSWKPWKSRDSGSESDGSSSESEKYRHRRTQDCYRCHQVEHIARYCPSTAVVESVAPTETAAAMTTTSIETD
jgi:hypothetical protein